MLRKFAIYLLIFAISFNVAGGFAIAASFKAVSFSVCQISTQVPYGSKTVVKKGSSELVIVISQLFKEVEEEKGQKFCIDFDYAITGIPYFLPLLRAGPAACYVSLYALAKGKNSPIYLLNCNFRV